MVKLVSPFVLYGSTNSGIKVKTIESTPTVKGKTLFPFNKSGTSFSDYVKRKIFKATKEEVSSLIKSTSNLNLAGKFSSKSSKSKGIKKSKQSTEQEKVNTSESLNHERDYDQSMEYETIKQSEVISVNEIQSTIESSTEEPTIELKPCRRFSLASLSKRNKKKTRFADDLTQSLHTPSCSTYPPSPSSPKLTSKGQSKLMKWSKKMRKCKVKPYEPMASKVAEIKSIDDKEDEKMKEPIKWTKRIRKFAVRTCRYLGYGAQMVSPLTPYTDIPMPVTYDANYNIYPPYYGSNHYYSYSSCGSVYGYKMSHYGLTY